MKTILLLAFHFFISGFAQYYYLKTRPRKDMHIAVIWFGTLIGGVYFIGWWALLTFFLGAPIGSKMYFEEISQNNDDQLK